MTATEPVCRATHADPHSSPLPEARARLRPTVVGQRNGVRRNPRRAAALGILFPSNRIKGGVAIVER